MQFWFRNLHRVMQPVELTATQSQVLGETSPSTLRKRGEGEGEGEGLREGEGERGAKLLLLLLLLFLLLLAASTDFTVYLLQALF